MPRERKNKADRWMPPRVYRGRSGYEYHPKSGGSTTLCPLSATEGEVWMAYHRARGEIVREDCSWLAGKYFGSREFLRLSQRTQKDYRAHWVQLGKTFGHVAPAAVKPAHVRKYADMRGAMSETMANKEVKVLRIVMRYAAERGIIRDNPCQHVKLYPERGRDRYITDAEYEAFYAVACPTLRIFMELAYICAARGQDIRKILMSDLNDEGLFITQQKTGKKQIKLWNARLRQVVAAAKALRMERNPLCTNLLVSEARGPYSEFGLKSLWRRAKAKYKALHGEPGFTFHDIKAKGVSDFEGDRQLFSGHKTRQMMERYNRTPDRTPVIDFKKKY